MKRIFVFGFFLMAMQGLGQNFTNGSVFDHQVGDTIIEEYYETLLFNSTAPPIITQRVFTNKVISPGKDTIFYSEQITINQLELQNFTMSYTNTSASYYVTNLQNSITNYTFYFMLPCQYQSDTSYLDACGLNVHVKESHIKKPNQGCFEPSYSKKTYIEKVGVYQKSSCGNCLPRGLTTVTQLLYSSVNRCGMPFVLVNGIEAQSLNNLTLNVFPNPSSGVYYVNSPDYGSLQITDLLGKHILTAQLSPGTNTIDLKEQPLGIYFFTAEFRGYQSSMKVVKQ